MHHGRLQEHNISSLGNSCKGTRDLLGTRMDKALEPTWETEWISSSFVDEVKDIKKKSLRAQEGPQERNKPQEFQPPVSRFNW